MSAAEAIADLDAELRDHGQVIELVRGDAGADDQKLPHQAFVRGYQPRELSGGIEQGDREVTLSPTGLAVEPKRLGGIYIDGRYCTIELANPVRLAGTVVRWNLQVRG